VIIRCHKCRDRLSVDGQGNIGANRAKQLGWRQRRVLVRFGGRDHLSVVWFCGDECDPREQRA
jgi:hypothetical protein